MSRLSLNLDLRDCMHARSPLGLILLYMPSNTFDSTRAPWATTLFAYTAWSGVQDCKGAHHCQGSDNTNDEKTRETNRHRARERERERERDRKATETEPTTNTDRPRDKQAGTDDYKHCKNLEKVYTSWCYEGMCILCCHPDSQSEHIQNTSVFQWLTITFEGVETLNRC